MSDFSEAFAEVVGFTSPDDEPRLSKGDGVTPQPELDIDDCILASARGTVWTASATVTHGAYVLPTVRNGRVYRVVIGGALGTVEPTAWPTYDYGQVTSGTATLEDAGYFAGNLYDLRAAKYAALGRKLAKAVNDNQWLGGGREQASTYLFLNLQRLRETVRPVGVA